MSAEHLDFKDNQFDIVCISNTLHHLPEVEKVIEEMKRVVKKDGYVVIHEMISDDQTEKQNTHVWLHHLNADIDSANGIYHGHTYTKKNELNEILTKSNLKIVSQLEYEVQDDQLNGDEDEVLNKIFETLHKRINKIKDDNNKVKYRDELNRNHKRLYNTGFALATECLVITNIK